MVEVGNDVYLNPVEVYSITMFATNEQQWTLTKTLARDTAMKLPLKKTEMRDSLQRIPESLSGTESFMSIKAFIMLRRR